MRANESAIEMIDSLERMNEELVKMDDEISPIFEKIETNSRQIKSLEKMRDTLLPKLLSGEVRVEI